MKKIRIWTFLLLGLLLLTSLTATVQADTAPEQRTRLTIKVPESGETDHSNDSETEPKKKTTESKSTESKSTKSQKKSTAPKEALPKMGDQNSLILSIVGGGVISGVGLTYWIRRKRTN